MYMYIYSVDPAVRSEKLFGGHERWMKDLWEVFGFNAAKQLTTKWGTLTLPKP